jgi:membrane-bound lytic murein transglycosylase D
MLTAAALIILIPRQSYSQTFLPSTNILMQDPSEISQGGGSARSISTEIPSMAGKDSCAAIRDLSILERQEVREALFVYLTGGIGYTKQGITRAQKYLPLIEEILRENSDIPFEAAYLPFLESGYSPTAVSRMQAVGIWQIIAPTARELGLKIEPWIDERRDPKKSTLAAIKHLRDLRQSFTNWDLAFAAYNCGSGRVARAIAKNRSTDFWDLADRKSFRLETKNYIPHYAALALIMTHPDLFMVSAKEDEEKPSTETFALKDAVMISTIANICGISSSTIYELNPELTARFTPPTIRGYEIVLPSGAGEMLAVRADELYRVKISYVTPHTVKKGESLGKISKAYGINLDLLASLNGLAKPYLLRTGRVLYIPKT